jgi:hypothetical protein
MSNEELARLAKALDDVSVIAEKANKVFGFVKYLIWAVVGLGSIIAGSGVWVYATNRSLKQEADNLISMKAERVITLKEWSEWREHVTQIEATLTTNQKTVLELVARHQKFIEEHGWPTILIKPVDPSK